MDERLKMAAFAFLAAAATAGIWLMQTGPKSASASVDPIPQDQKLASLVQTEVARQLPAAVDSEVKHQLDIAARKAQDKKQADDDLLRQEAEKWAPAYQAQSDLQTLRSMLSLYHLQHHNTWPTQNAMKDWQALLTTTTSEGTTFGPYLQSAPLNLFNQKTSVTLAGQATPDAGFTYDPNTGTLHIIVPTSDLIRAKPLNGDFEIAR